MAQTSGIVKILIQLLSLQAIYQSSPEKIRLELPGLVARLLFDSESRVQELVKGLRKVWEQDRETKLEVNSSYFKLSFVRFIISMYQTDDDRKDPNL